MNKCWRCENNK